MEIQWSLMSAERESACAREGRHSSLSTSFIFVIRLTCVMRALSVQACVPARASARVTKCACEVVISKGKGTCQTHSSSGSQAACCCRLVQKCEPAANLLRLQASGPQVRARPPGAAEAARSGRGSAHSSIILGCRRSARGGCSSDCTHSPVLHPSPASGHTRLRPQSDFPDQELEVCGDRPTRVCWPKTVPLILTILAPSPTLQ